jgi:hypothetical protein
VTTNTRTAFALLVLTAGVAGCGTPHSVSAPSSIQESPQPPAPQPTGLQPTVTAIGPNVGSIRGGAWGTITGTNFQAGATVKLGDSTAAALVHTSTTIWFWGTASRVSGSVDVIVTNPGGLAATLTGAYTYASPDSFDFNGNWVAHAGPDYEIDMRFTIRNNELVGVACGNSAAVTFSPPPLVHNGEVSVVNADGLAISGTLVAPLNSEGTINVPGCLSARWWADKK